MYATERKREDQETGQKAFDSPQMVENDQMILCSISPYLIKDVGRALIQSPDREVEIIGAKCSQIGLEYLSHENGDEITDFYESPDKQNSFSVEMDVDANHRTHLLFKSSLQRALGQSLLGSINPAVKALGHQCLNLGKTCFNETGFSIGQKGYHICGVNPRTQTATIEFDLNLIKSIAPSLRDYDLKNDFFRLYEILSGNTSDFGIDSRLFAESL